MMPHISIRNVSLDFLVHGSDARSFRRTILSRVTGGKLLKGSGHSIRIKALDNISLEIAAGDRVGLVGHNGAGKTTLLRVLAGLYRPSSGVVEINGAVTTLLDPFAGTDGDATGIDNIYMRGAVLGLSRNEIKQRLPEIATTSQLGDFLNLPIRTYSAGMFARLSFAVTALLNPDIMLVDEGFGAGDAAFMETMHATLAKLSRQSILIMASHDMGFINRFCNTLVRFDRGQILEVVANEAV